MVQTAEPLSLVRSLAQGERLREPAATQPLRLQGESCIRELSFLREGPSFSARRRYAWWCWRPLSHRTPWRRSAASSRVPMLLHRRTKIADLMAQIKAHWELSTPLAFD